MPPAAEVEPAGVATAEATNRIKQLEVENHNKDLRIEELTQSLKEMEEVARRDHRKYEKEIKSKEADVTQIQSELKNSMIKIEKVQAENVLLRGKVKMHEQNEITNKDMQKKAEEIINATLDAQKEAPQPRPVEDAVAALTGDGDGEYDYDLEGWVKNTRSGYRRNDPTSQPTGVSPPPPPAAGGGTAAGAGTWHRCWCGVCRRQEHGV